MVTAADLLTVQDGTRAHPRCFYCEVGHRVVWYRGEGGVGGGGGGGGVYTESGEQERVICLNRKQDLSA